MTIFTTSWGPLAVAGLALLVTACDDGAQDLAMAEKLDEISARLAAIETATAPKEQAVEASTTQFMLCGQLRGSDHTYIIAGVRGKS